MDNYEDHQRHLGFGVYVSDFANIFKVFIGANFLSIPFGFAQCGLAVGTVGIVFIAALTGHCCQLLVKSKYLAIDHLAHLLRHSSNFSLKDLQKAKGSLDIPYSQKIISHSIDPDMIRQASDNGTTDLLITKLTNHLMKTMQYSDLACLSMGTPGAVLTQLALIITQVGFCINYAIFTATAVFEAFPVYNCSVQFVNNTSLQSQDCQYLDNSTREIWLEKQENFSRRVLDSVALEPTSLPENVAKTQTSDTAEDNSRTSSWSMSWTDRPDMQLLFLIPVAIFLILIMPRKMRGLGIISAIGNIACCTGGLFLIIAVLTQFNLSDSWLWVRLEGLPIFFGATASAFEGAGTVLSIEASMGENRRNYTAYLVVGISVLASAHCCLCVSSYLSYGSSTAQLVTMSIQQNQTLKLAINGLLVGGMICTFPVMMFPAVEIIERLLLGKGGLCSKNTEDKGDKKELIASTQHSSPHGTTSIFCQALWWKGNVIRISLVLIVGMLGALLRDNFAYITAFIGALGCTFVAFILPCLFHIKLGWSSLPLFTKVKDLVIIVVGVFFCITGVYTVIKNLTAQ